MGYFGEGGGCFGMGKSRHVLCMHHHNVAYSSRCGKNMSRLVVPHGASVGPHDFTRKRGSRTEPAGDVYAPMTMGQPPWDTFVDKALSCAQMVDLGVHTSYSCLSHVDIGLEYRWYPGVNAAVWRGDTDAHCHLCVLPGEPSTWNMTSTKGAIVYALQQRKGGRKARGGRGEDKGSKGEKKEEGEDEEDKEDDANDEEDGDDDDDNEDEDGGDDDDDDDDDQKDPKARFKRLMDRTRTLEWGGELPAPRSGLSPEELSSTSNPNYVLKSSNFGANWTWILLPPFLQKGGSFRADPTNDTVLYIVSPDCIGRSYDGAVTWQDCWEADGLEGPFQDLVIKDSQTMIVMRTGAVPLRTRDGGRSWERLGSVQNLVSCRPGALYSWSGKTLALSCVLGRTLVWVSRDDGDTWVDESGDYTATSGGIAQWYENTLYVSSLGQGISSKTFRED